MDFHDLRRWLGILRRRIRSRLEQCGGARGYAGRDPRVVWAIKPR